MCRHAGPAAQHHDPQRRNSSRRRRGFWRVQPAQQVGHQAGKVAHCHCAHGLRVCGPNQFLAISCIAPNEVWLHRACMTCSLSYRVKQRRTWGSWKQLADHLQHRQYRLQPDSGVLRLVPVHVRLAEHRGHELLVARRPRVVTLTRTQELGFPCLNPVLCHLYHWTQQA